MSVSMLNDAAATAGAVSSEQAYHDDGGVPGTDLTHVVKRYGEERAKRLRADANDQFVDISLSSEERFRRFQEDPWANPAEVKDIHTMFPDNRCRMLVIGAGWSGILQAVRMIDAGAVKPEELRIIDTAGGFGGTWYWNRYPGLACDIESYCYMPLLEETGYVPRHRYSAGHEIRDYANLVAKKWGFADSAVFQTRPEKLTWDESAKEWVVDLVQQRGGSSGQPVKLQIRSRFVTMSGGVLNWPKLPGIPGILDFTGHTFHTSRWDYNYTGGSQADPSLINLKDKRVAILGTGATAVQAVPHLARWCKHLYVVQRTPSAVDVRNQRETDPEWFRKEVADSKGWQQERRRNFNLQFTTGTPPATDKVADSWTSAPTLASLVGNPDAPKSMDELPAFLEKINAMDVGRQNRVRARALEIVKDQDVASKLQAWYPSWCKRPTFHDEYLQSFNRDNVTLVDTAGRGLDRITADSIVSGDNTYPVDAIIFATGYRAPLAGTPADKANTTIVGRGGASMSDTWATVGPSTLHGVLDHHFPNLLLSGPWQAAGTPNYIYALDTLAKHAAYIVAEAQRKAADPAAPLEVAVTNQGAEDWAAQIIAGGAAMAAAAGCTPNYFNLEGAMDKMSPQAMQVLARSGIWGGGIEPFIDHIEAWQAEGNMHGIEVKA